VGSHWFSSAAPKPSGSGSAGQGAREVVEVRPARDASAHLAPEDPLEHPPQLPEPGNLGAGGSGVQRSRLAQAQEPGSASEADRVPEVAQIVDRRRDRPVLGGPDVNELADLLGPLLRHPRALGMQLTIYDPMLDPDETCGRRLVGLLEQLFRS
jgi:hypothetical protein